MESTADILTMSILSLAFFTALVLIIFILAKYTYLTRKAYVDSGQQPGTMQGSKFIYQDIACIVMGLGAGLGVSSLISVLNLSEDTMDLLIYCVIAMFTGAGLFVAHLLRRRAQ